MADGIDPNPGQPVFASLSIRRSRATPAAKAGRRAKLTEAEALRAPQARILDVAHELFCRDGIHATGIERVLAAANVSKMTLYARFGSKDALVAEVLRREGEAQRALLTAGLDAAGPHPLDQLGRAVAALRPWFESTHYFGCALMNAAAEYTKGHPTLRALAADHHRRILHDLGARAERAGLSEPAMVARQILLVIDGAIAALMVSGDRSVLDVAERNLAAVLQAAKRVQA